MQDRSPSDFPGISQPGQAPPASCRRPSHPTADYDGRQLFLLDGTLSGLQTASTKAGLLDKLATPRRRGTSGAAAASGAMHQALAGETYLCEFDDVETHIFAARLDGLAIYGMFEHADQLADGDVLGAVVSGSDELLYVHSVIRRADDLLLLPYGVYAGEQALVRDNKRAMWKWIAGIWIMFEVFFLACMYAEGAAIPAQTFLMSSIAILILNAGVIRLGLGSPYQIMPGGEQAQAIFTVYGFPLPQDFDARKGAALFPGKSSPFHATNAQTALARHRARFKLDA